jgi:hypothetical protein
MVSRIVPGVGLCLALFAATTAADGQESDLDPPKTPAEILAEKNEGRVRGSELAQELSGAEIAEGLPSVFFAPGMHLHIPYQVLGFGAAMDFVPVEWLRLSAVYAFGMTPTQDGIVWTNYAEAYVGVRVLGTTRESPVDIPLKKRGRGLFPKIPVVKAWVPAYHALFIEAGATTGFSSLEICGEDCASVPEGADTSDKRQLIMPLGGVRFVYAYDIRSQRRNIRKRFLLQLYGHLLGKPFNAPDQPRFFPNDRSAGRPGFGGRMGIALPPFGACIAQIAFGFGCADGNFALGYAPYPRFLIFDLQIAWPIY